MTATTSRAIATWKLLFTHLQAAFTAAGKSPDLVIMGGSFDPANEGVLLSGVPASGSSIDRATNLGKDEVFVLRAHPFCLQEANTAFAALDVVAGYADIVQNSMRDVNGRPVTSFQTELGVSMAIPEVVAWTPRLSGDPRGVYAVGDLDIQFRIRI